MVLEGDFIGLDSFSVLVLGIFGDISFDIGLGLGRYL